MKGYIIIEKGYEYDDNYYNPNEDGGGVPTKIFYTKQAAAEALSDYEFQAHTDRNITDYYGKDYMKDEHKWESLCESMEKKYGEMKPDPWRGQYKRPNIKMSKEERKEYLSLFTKNLFYTIVEAEFDTQDMRDYKINMVIK
jgi:hypothetical protein